MTFLVNKKEYTIETDDNINCIILYGSVARYENDSYSDIDILIVTETEKEKKYVITDLQGNKLPDKWITIYSKRDINRMLQYTSLFLWHLKMEAIFIFKKDNYIETVLENLPEYTKTAEDVRQYKIICEDIKKVIIYENETMFYELSLLASLVRNLSIAFCYLKGEKCFGRNRPVEILLKDYPIFSMEEYKELYVFRSKYNMGVQEENNLVNKTLAMKWIENVELLIEFVEKLL